MQPNPQAALADAGPGALRTFFKILERWGLGADEGRVLLGGVSKSTYYRWRQDPNGAELSADTLERISYVLGIYKALALIYSDKAAADGWIRRPNTNAVFGGQPPLERLLGGRVADLYVTREILDARRGVV